MLNDTQNTILEAMLARRPDLADCRAGLLRLYSFLSDCYDQGGTLYLCGNGGSYADCMHIVGELCKSFERKRPIPEDLANRLRALPNGEALAEHLETGFRAHALGGNGALKSAVENDCPERDIAYAQELNALVRPGDLLLALSTSGNAMNCRLAMSVARAHYALAVSLTGPDGGAMAREADLALRAPGDSTKTIQEAHEVLWHSLCLLIEAKYFQEMR